MTAAEADARTTQLLHPLPSADNTYGCDFSVCIGNTAELHTENRPPAAAAAAALRASTSRGSTAAAKLTAGEEVAPCMPPLLLRPPPPPPTGGLAAPGDAVPGAAHPCRLAMGVRSAARCSRAACAIHENRALLQRIWKKRPRTVRSAGVAVHSCAQKPVVAGQHWTLQRFYCHQEQHGARFEAEIRT